MGKIEPMGDEELAEVRERAGGPVAASFDFMEVEAILARLDAAEAERDEYKLQMHAACADVDVLTHQRDRLQAVVDKLLEWNAESFQDYNPGPNSDSHSTRWICPVCCTIESDGHDPECPVEAALAAKCGEATEDEPQGARDEA